MQDVIATYPSVGEYTMIYDKPGQQDYNRLIHDHNSDENSRAPVTRDKMPDTADIIRLEAWDWTVHAR